MQGNKKTVYTDPVFESLMSCRHYQAFYDRFHLPTPTLHPDLRHRARFLARNPRKLWKRACKKCQKKLETSYSPERLEKIYCEECYQVLL